MQDADLPPMLSGDAGSAPTPDDAARDQLVAARRDRQKGQNSRSTSARLMMGGGLLAAGLLLIVSFAGPAAALRFFGGGVAEGQKASEVSLKVDNPAEERVPLDFAVPAAPQKEDNGLNETIKELQAQIAELERNRKLGMSSVEVQQMLSRSEEITRQQIARERQKMAEENARLQKLALEAEDARRRAEEAARNAAGTEKERQEREKLQRESDAVIVDDAGSPALLEQSTLSEERDPNRRFFKSAASSVVQTAMAQRIPDPAHLVVQGTIISAVLETAIDTQLPGNLRAQVMEPVFSFDGSRVLMPEGTLLIGEFNNDVALAQTRVMIAWNRAVTPDGQSVALGSLGTDRLGRSGTLGNIDNRYATKFGAAALISAITAVPTMLASREAGSGGSGTTLNINGGNQIAKEVGGNLGNQTNEVLSEYLSLPPVIRIPQGEEIRIFVNRDLVFR